MMQFEANDALFYLNKEALAFISERINGVEPDLTRELRKLERPFSEYCNELVKEFRSNVLGQPVELIKKYTEVLYYQLIYDLLKLEEYHVRYYKKFGMDAINERLANDYLSPMSILVTNVWRISWQLSIAELVEFGDINLADDFDLNGDYKPLFSYNKYAQKEHERKLKVASTSGRNRIPKIRTGDESFTTANELSKRSKHPKDESQYTSFKKLFIDVNEIDSCVNALREFDRVKPVLGVALNWIGGPKRKGLIVAWIEVLESLNKIYRLEDRKQLVVLLNRYFNNLDMGENARVFENPTDRDAKDRFSALIAR